MYKMGTMAIAQSGFQYYQRDQMKTHIQLLWSGSVLYRWIIFLWPQADSHDEKLSYLPRADSHQWYWEAGKEDGAKEKGLPPPHIRQSAYERGTQKREQALEKKKEAKVRFMMWSPNTCNSHFLNEFLNAPVHCTGSNTE